VGDWVWALLASRHLAGTRAGAGRCR
jgi:hypothetical protein